MGHLCPHVHCHVYPQYAHDNPHALIDVRDGTTRLTDDEWRARLTAVRKSLASHYP
jgi:diadenosine tetraphosphate (Ap4A) HIT family hydrolase